MRLKKKKINKKITKLENYQKKNKFKIILKLNQPKSEKTKRYKKLIPKYNFFTKPKKKKNKIKLIKN
jgi:hypothetical protein